MTRDFHIGDILSITTGRLVSTRGIEGVYDILNFMTGESFFTHQLPRAAKECAPWLLRQHPNLKDIKTDSLDALLAAPPIAEARRNHENAEKIWQQKAAKYRQSGRRADQLEMWDANEYVKATRGDLQLLNDEAIAAWLSEQSQHIGSMHLPVTPVPADDHVVCGPVAELEEMVGKDKVIVIEGGAQ